MPSKSLGQHWLTDAASLQAIVDFADLKAGEHVLEIGPGLGHLSDYLLKTSAQVTALEYDRVLMSKLKARYQNHQITILAGDIRRYDLTDLPADYKICANIPYYLTANLVRRLVEATNKPALAVLLLQKEVAVRLTRTDRYSLLSVLASVWYDPEAGIVVPAQLFEPAPKVDSQVIKLTRRPKPLVLPKIWPSFSRLVKIGFANPRKQLYHNLAAGFHLPKPVAKDWLSSQKIDFSLRAEQLTVDQWLKLTSSQPLQRENHPS